MYVQVLYYNERVSAYQSGRGYTYHTELPLHIGDKVLVPVSSSNELKKAIVISINVPDSEIGDSWRDKIKEIKEMDGDN